MKIEVTLLFEGTETTLEDIKKNLALALQQEFCLDAEKVTLSEVKVLEK